MREHHADYLAAGVRLGAARGVLAALIGAAADRNGPAWLGLRVGWAYRFNALSIDDAESIDHVLAVDAAALRALTDEVARDE
ncbi:hypothetical protein ACIGO9_30785 [Nocardia asteroides]|uniref:hypothetical protein n=1 Tax=Nocardia asteroides TaxID=1824 RepID=UPI0037CA6B31